MEQATEAELKRLCSQLVRFANSNPVRLLIAEWSESPEQYEAASDVPWPPRSGEKQRRPAFDSGRIVYDAKSIAQTSIGTSIEAIDLRAIRAWGPWVRFRRIAAAAGDVLLDIPEFAQVLPSRTAEWHDAAERFLWMLCDLPKRFRPPEHYVWADFDSPTERGFSAGPSVYVDIEDGATLSAGILRRILEWAEFNNLVVRYVGERAKVFRQVAKRLARAFPPSADPNRGFSESPDWREPSSDGPIEYPANRLGLMVIDLLARAGLRAIPESDELAKRVVLVHAIIVAPDLAGLTHADWGVDRPDGFAPNLRRALESQDVVPDLMSATSPGQPDWFDLVGHSMRRLDSSGVTAGKRSGSGNLGGGTPPKSEPRTAPMSKSELARRILNKQNARARDIDWTQYSLQPWPAGCPVTKHTRQWTIRTDCAAIDAATLARLTKSVG